MKARSRRNLVVTRHSGDGPLTEPTAAPQPWPRERNLMPQSRPSWGCSATAESGGKPTLRTRFLSKLVIIPATPAPRCVILVVEPALC